MDGQGELERAKKLIYEHDLSRTIRRITSVNGWSKKHAIEACKQYRNFLFLKKKYGNQYALPPSYEIDEFWHTHILHTKSYYNFCKEVFGEYLHHHPHHGMDMEVPDHELRNAFEEQTQKLYQQEFGEYIYAIKPTGIIGKIYSILENIASFFSGLTTRKLAYKS